MTHFKLWSLLGSLLFLSACSESDTTVGPDATPGGPPVIRLFIVRDADVVHGNWTQIQWRIDGAESAVILTDVGIVRKLLAGTHSIRPTEPVTFTLTASNDRGTVTASASVTVTFRAGVYVNPISGLDTNSGANPNEALATLEEALIRTQAGGTLFLAASTYDSNIVIDSARRLIYGGLHPETFLEEPGFNTVIRPTTGTPVIIRNTGQQMSLLNRVTFDARWGGEYAISVENAPVVVQDCMFDGSYATSGTAMRLLGSTSATISRSRIRGGGDLPFSPVRNEATGIAVEGTASLVIRNSFVSGGTGSVHSSGVDVNTGGGVTVGLCTVSAGLTSINGQDAAAIRIRAGRPALGGNIFFTRGTGKRPAVLEEAADADPSRFEANLIFSVSQPAYDNYATDGLDASDTAALNNFQIINNISGTVRENLLVTAAAADVFESVSQLDYHLVNPSRAGGPNPAVDSLPQVFNGPLYGIQTDGPPDDIDGELRPNSYLQYDRGADEF